MSRATLLQLTPICLGGQDFAVDILSIREVITPLPVTPVPGAPRFVEGVIDLRGRVLPVIDLRVKLGVAPGPATRHLRFVIATVAGWSAALVVDSVGEPMRVTSEEILAAPALTPGDLRSPIFKGLVRSATQTLVVLDLATLLSSEERADLGRVLP